MSRIASSLARAAAGSRVPARASLRAVRSPLPPLSRAVTSAPPSSFTSGPSIASASFSTTRAARASESDAPQFPTLPPGFEKIAESPEAIQAIQQLAKLLEERGGVDLKSGERPGIMTMMKLANDKEVRGQVQKVMEALNKAGVDLSPENMRNMMAGFGGFPDDRGNGGKKK